MTTPSARLPATHSGSPCPCGSGKSFGKCCEPILKQERTAGTAEELMRSRFTAHALRDYVHLHRTFLPTAHLPYAAENDLADMTWTRLVIHAHEAGPKPEIAYVDFSAYYQEEGIENVLHEKSEFLRVDGAWFFNRPVRSGPAPLKSAQPKVGRNEPCPCGSGKKYKHCCLKN